MVLLWKYKIMKALANWILRLGAGHEADVSLKISKDQASDFNDTDSETDAMAELIAPTSYSRLGQWFCDLAVRPSNSSTAVARWFGVRWCGCPHSRCPAEPAMRLR